MLQNLDRTTSLIGESGRKYTFALYSFDSFDDLKGLKKMSALYLFTRRKFVDGSYYHDYLYFGETGDLSTRYNNHHKEKELVKEKSNCIGFYTSAPDDEDARKKIEEDVLAANNFPLNTANNS